MIKIGETSLSTTAKPADLDAQLLAATGCSPAEVARMLGGHPLAGFVATAARPFITDKAPDDLTDQIQAAGVVEIAAKVRALYDSVDIEPADSSASVETKQSGKPYK